MCLANQYLFSSSQSGQIDRESGIDGFTLMQMAGFAMYQKICGYCKHRTQTGTLHVLCGAGNNAGDGYIVAHCAMKAGIRVRVTSVRPCEKLKGEALAACQQFREAGGVIQVLSGSETPEIKHSDIVVDALLGTGIKGDVSVEYARVIECINNSNACVVSLDVPSGLCGDTGRIAGVAVRAALTVGVISLKPGFFTCDGPDCCGHLEFVTLGLPDVIYEKVSSSGRLLDMKFFSNHLSLRKKNGNKGDYGSLLLAGGEKGMGGSIIMAAEAAMASGVGKVTVLTREEHVSPLLSRCPEVMVHACENVRFEELLAGKSAVVVGPGAGRSDWSKSILQAVFQLEMPVLFDADALNMIAENPEELSFTKRSSSVFTPHPGEAARLLQESTDDIQKDRFGAIRRLYEKLGGSVVLKGCGSMIYSGDSIRVCAKGNAAMAVAGCGDVLSGLVGGLLAQGYSADFSACLGVWLHAAAGDCAAEAMEGQTGLRATELIHWIRLQQNRLIDKCDRGKAGNFENVIS